MHGICLSLGFWQIAENLMLWGFAQEVVIPDEDRIQILDLGSRIKDPGSWIHDLAIQDPISSIQDPGSIWAQVSAAPRVNLLGSSMANIVTFPSGWEDPAKCMEYVFPWGFAENLMLWGFAQETVIPDEDRIQKWHTPFVLQVQYYACAYQLYCTGCRLFIK